MRLLYFITAFIACIIGKLCGMGGGVLIKPVLDSVGLDTIAVINFLSGCTVLGMSLWSVGKSSLKGESDIDWTTSTPLALGAAAGGVFGKSMFSHISGLLANPDKAGAVQAILLFVATFLTLLYTIKKEHIKGLSTKSKLSCVAIGFVLGTLGAFLGIGGGPFNMAVLYFFFSMTTKVAAQNSLYVILISQATALISTILTRSVPDVKMWVLMGMIACGVAGSEIGARINKRISDAGATRLFEGAMVLVMAICVYNIIRFV